jgi:hypothetical protein
MSTFDKIRFQQDTLSTRYAFNIVHALSVTARSTSARTGRNNAPVGNDFDCALDCEGVLRHERKGRYLGLELRVHDVMATLCEAEELYGNQRDHGVDDEREEAHFAF